MDGFQKKNHKLNCSVGFFLNVTTFNQGSFPMTNSTYFFFIPFFLLFSAPACSTDQNPTNISNYENSGKQKDPYRILILGDSLTEGYGVMESEAYPTLLEHKLNQEISPKTKINYEIINGGLTGSTSSGGVSRISWFLKGNPDHLILALGGNDGLRGIPPKETQKNLSKIIQKARDKKIPVLLAGMKIPPNYGLKYTQEFADLFFDLAKENQVPLIPFLLEGVGGNPNYNLPDRIHPNAKGHELICDLVFSHLSKELKSNHP